MGLENAGVVLVERAQPSFAQWQQWVTHKSVGHLEGKITIWSLDGQHSLFAPEGRDENDLGDDALFPLAARVATATKRRTWVLWAVDSVFGGGAFSSAGKKRWEFPGIGEDDAFPARLRTMTTRLSRQLGIPQRRLEKQFAYWRIVSELKGASTRQPRLDLRSGDLLSPVGRGWKAVEPVAPVADDDALVASVNASRGEYERAVREGRLEEYQTRLLTTPSTVREFLLEDQPARR